MRSMLRVLRVRSMPRTHRMLCVLRMRAGACLRAGQQMVLIITTMSVMRGAWNAEHGACSACNGTWNTTVTAWNSRDCMLVKSTTLNSGSIILNNSCTNVKTVYLHPKSALSWFQHTILPNTDML